VTQDHRDHVIRLSDQPEQDRRGEPRPEGGDTGAVSLFTGTAEHYDRHRSGVPEEAVRLLVEATAPAPRRLLDLGTGTGIVVAALASAFEDVIAVDPDADMLEQARRRHGADGATWVQARAEDYVPPSGWSPDLVTICRAFHWMDQDAVLARIDACASSTTTIAVMGDGSVWTSTQPWKVAIREVIQEFLGERRRAGTGTHRGNHRPFHEILADSPFSRIEEHGFQVVRTRDAESVIGYLHSTSFAAEHLFGERVEAFRARVRDVVAAYAVDGVLEDRTVFEVILARRAS
jgi:trans-aconitate methyltransferase